MGEGEEGGARMKGCVCVGWGGYEESLLGRTERKRRNATVSKLEREGKK